MHIKIRRDSTNQAHLLRYKDLHQIKSSDKGLLNEYKKRISSNANRKWISSISHLQDRSSEFVESNIQRNSRGMSSSNIAATYDASSFSSSYITSPSKQSSSSQKRIHIFMGDHNIQKMMTSNEARLTVEISDIIISEGLSFNKSQKPRFKKVLDLARNVSKVINLLT